MSNSTSDSDSDDFEPVRKIKINIRPKDDPSAARKLADVSQIKASVDAWRPLGPPTHPSLAKRQSSLSSVSSMSFGQASSAHGSPFGTTTNMAFINTSNMATDLQPQHQHQFISQLHQPAYGVLQPSPSCSSLVNEFNSRSSSFIDTSVNQSLSRTSSPLTITGQTDAIPIAIAMQESIELIVRSQFGPSKDDPKFETQALGNIKIAFPNAFARSCSTRSRSSPALKLRLHSVDNIIKYYASGLIKDPAFSTENTKPSEFNLADTNIGFSQHSSPTDNNSKLIEFDMDKLSNQLKKLYDQSNLSRYYNVDFLRYQIKPIPSIEQSPLQVCAYWKLEEDVVKLRINFKHSAKCGVSMDRFKDITFAVDLSNFIPTGVEVFDFPPIQMHNNNTIGTMNMNKITSSTSTGTRFKDNSNTSSNSSIESSGSSNLVDSKNSSSFTIPPLLRPPTTLGRSTRGSSYSSGRSTRSDRTASSSGPTILDTPSNAQKTVTDKQDSSLQDLLSTFQAAPPATTPVVVSATTLAGQQFSNSAISNLPLIQTTSNHDSCKNRPFVVTEPRATWNSSIKQLKWKFDTLLSYHKTDGMGSLMAKLDFRRYKPSIPLGHLKSCKPLPVDVKFLISDSTLSKASLSLDTSGYRISLLKREIRSGRYRSEAYITP